MKKIIAVLISCIMVLNIIQPQIIDTTKQVRAASNGEFAGGTGTANDPYQIETAEQLNNVRNYMEAHFVLNRDIDMSNTKNFVPIGTKENPFKGFFNGNNHTINNLTIKQDDLDAVGLFGNSGDGDFRNISLDNLLIEVDIKSPSYTNESSYINVGGIVGCRDNKNEIFNCEVKGKINVDISKNDDHRVRIGGITGYNGNLYNCRNYAQINVINNENGEQVGDGIVECGGIAGAGAGHIEKCYNYGDIKGISGKSLSIGGISGSDGLISRCDNYGNISGRTKYCEYQLDGCDNCDVGGIVGETKRDTSYCTNYGDIYAKAEVGGSTSAGGISGRSGFQQMGRVQYCINSNNSIISQREKEESGEYVNISGNAGRIVGIKGGYGTGAIEECYSSDQTLLNGEIPTNKLNASQINGHSLSSEELKTQIKNNYADERNVIKLCPENNKINVKAKNAKGFFDIEVRFDGKVTVKKGLVYIKKQKDHIIKSYPVSSKLVEIKDDVLKIKDVQLPYGQDISILFDKNCIEVDGKVFLGFQTENDWNFRTEEPDFSDYDKYQANYLSQNASMQTSTSMIYSEIEDSYTPTKYALVNMLSLAWNSKFKYSDDSEIWETILIDAMLRKSYDKQASDDFLKDSAKMEVKLLKFIDDEQNIKQTDPLTEASKKKISDTLKEAKVEDVDIMNGMLDVAETAKDFVDKYTKYLELKSIISTDTTAFLKELKTTQNYKEIPAFQRAVDRVVECMDTNGDDMLAKIGQIVLKNKIESQLFTESFNSTMEKLMDVVMPELSKVVNLTKDPTIYLMDTICGTGNMAEVNIYLYMIDRIDEAAKEAYTNCTVKNIASNGEEKIQAVNGGYRFLIDLSTYGIGISRKWNYYISKNLLSKRISDKLNTVKRPLRDIVSGMLNLNKESTINEEQQYVLKRCSENDKYINAMKNLTAFARVNWYEDTGSDKNGDRALLLFMVKNPDGTTSVTAEVKAKNVKIEYPKVEDKSGYTTPTNWYTDEKCTQTATGNLTVSKNQIFYTEYYAEGEYEIKASEGLKICKIYKAGQSRNAIAKSARKIVDKTKCEIPSYIDGYKVTELGEDIFSELPAITEIYIPTTVKTINKDAFKSLPKETLYHCDKDSYAEKFLHNMGYENIKVENTVKDNNENSIPSEVTEQKPEQTTTPQTQQIKVSQIKLSALSTKIAAGKKIKLTADITKNASNKTLKWTTSNSKVATVDKNGVVTIKKKAGGKTVKITARATDGSGKKATFTIKVMKGVVKKVKISGKKTVKAGKTLKLKAKVTASKGANKKLKWTSSNPKYAIVSASGKVKASKAGKKKSVKITARATDGSGKKATVKIKIK